jgi:hypothetical protein
MHRIRPFREDDVSRVAGLYQAVFGGAHEAPTAALEQDFREVFFQSPWRDEDLPSLIYERDSGTIAGFLGVMPRRMLMKGRPIRVAVATSFMVEPSRPAALAGVQLLKTFFSGPQDLSLTDAANDSSRKIWEAVGGAVAPLYSLYWTRSLRLVRHALQANRGPLRLLVSLLNPFSCVLDPLAARVLPNWALQPPSKVLDRELDAQTMLKDLTQFSGGVALRPEYDERSLTWLLKMAGEKRQFGLLRKRLVLHAGGEACGWYLYYLNPGGVSQVLQFAAQRQSISHVLHCLFFDAYRHGSVALSGRIEPRYIQELSESHCWFRCGSWTLVQSRDPELLHTIHSGDGFLTRLEGEWWTRFLELVR